MKFTARTFLNLALVVTIVRLSVIVFITVFQDNQQLLTQIKTDIFHHYHIGFAALVISIFVRQPTVKKLLLIIGLGILLEEWTLILRDIGLPTSINYLGYTDIAIAYSTVAIVYTVKTKFDRQG